MASPAKAFGTPRSLLRLAGGLLAGALVALPPIHASAQSFDDDPDWIPSIAIGAGFYSRRVDGEAGGFFRTDLGPNPASGSNCGSQPPFVGICFLDDQDNTAVDGFASSYIAQLLGPAWDEGPWRPRPFVHGGFALPSKERLVVADGFKPSDFDSIGQRPKVRIELDAEPRHFWWLGIGTAFELPIDLHPIRLKISLNYSEDKTNYKGRVFEAVNTDAQVRPVIGLVKGKRQETVRSLGPGLGLETVLGQVGPIAIGLAADTLVSFALNDTSNRFPVAAQGFFRPNEPPAGQATFDYDPESVHVYGFVSIRFSWIGP
jgi:hypothetical protein